jgi:acyl carrier protein
MSDPSLTHGALCLVRERFAYTLDLDVSEVEASDSFFDLGGNSLLVLEAVDGIAAGTGVSIPLAFFFQNPTPVALAGYVKQAGRSPGEQAGDDQPADGDDYQRTRAVDASS